MGLRRVSTARVERSGFWIFATHRVYYSRRDHFALSPGDYRRARSALAASGVALIGREADRVLWWTTQGFYWAEPELSAEQVELLLWNRQRRQETQFERLEKIRARQGEPTAARRTPIPDEVKAAVWQRDGGACVRCGSEDDLQFDHVIPVARGGGSGLDNVQVLCGDCNRAKSDSIV